MTKILSLVIFALIINLKFWCNACNYGDIENYYKHSHNWVDLDNNCTLVTNIWLKWTRFFLCIHKTLHILTIYPSKMSINLFSSTLKIIWTKIPQNFPTTTIGDSNVSMLIKTFKQTIQQTLMEKYHLKFRLFKFTIIYHTNKSHMGKCTNTIVSFWIIGYIINLYISHSNYQILYMHAI